MKKIELNTRDLQDELLQAFACYIAKEWDEGEFDEAKAHKAYDQILRLLKTASNEEAASNARDAYGGYREDE